MIAIFLPFTGLLSFWTGLVVAQDYSGFVPACEMGCAAYVRTSSLCGQQYPPNNGNFPPSSLQACFCDDISQANVADCATCLSANKAPSVAQLVLNTTKYCKDFAQNCVYQCDFPTCDSLDIACQCNTTYLQNIYDCASCNSANNNPGKTELPDFDSLQQSCINQGIINVNQVIKSTKPYPSPTSVAGYVEPSLTGSGVYTPSLTSMASLTAATDTSVASAGATDAKATTTPTAIRTATTTTTTHAAEMTPTTQTHVTVVSVTAPITNNASSSALSSTPTGSLAGAVHTNGAQRKSISSIVTSGATVFLLSLLT
ncbi:hypothetical protein FRB97_006212 [Tulasnella sp. 331]|nr:hypothetical protein FRB97_006212 [Tulasnella sp. 331]